MARTVKNPDVRRNEIIDVAQGLFLSKGYEQTSVQDIWTGPASPKAPSITTSVPSWSYWTV